MVYCTPATSRPVGRHSPRASYVPPAGQRGGRRGRARSDMWAHSSAGTHRDGPGRFATHVDAHTHRHTQIRAYRYTCTHRHRDSLTRTRAHTRNPVSSLPPESEPPSVFPTIPPAPCSDGFHPSKGWAGPFREGQGTEGTSGDASVVLGPLLPISGPQFSINVHDVGTAAFAMERKLLYQEPLSRACWLGQAPPGAHMTTLRSGGGVVPGHSFPGARLGCGHLLAAGGEAPGPRGNRQARLEP